MMTLMQYCGGFDGLKRNLPGHLLSCVPIIVNICATIELETVELEYTDAFQVMKKVLCGFVGNMPISSPTVSSLMNQ